MHTLALVHTSNDMIFKTNEAPFIKDKTLKELHINHTIPHIDNVAYLRVKQNNDNFTGDRGRSSLVASTRGVGNYSCTP